MLEPKLEPMLEPKPPHESMSLHLALPEPEPIFLFQIRPEPKPCSGPCLNPSIHLNPCLFSKPCLNQCPCLDPCSCTKPCLNLKRTPEGMLFRTSHQPRGPGPPFWVALYGVTFFGGDVMNCSSHTKHGAGLKLCMCMPMVLNTHFHGTLFIHFATCVCLVSAHFLIGYIPPTFLSVSPVAC